MLILSRRVNESLVIGDDTTITVLGIKGNQVRIGINSPKDTPVHREEVYRRIKPPSAELESVLSGVKKLGLEEAS